MVSWHPDGTIVVVANERGQFQCFDIALSCIKNQFISEDMTPSNLIDLGSYFKNQPTLLELQWSRKTDSSLYSEKYIQTDGLLLLQFERGPLAVLRLVGGGGVKHDIHGAGFTPDALVTLYLNVNQVDRAVNLLLSLNWDSYGFICLACLNRIANHLFRQPLTPEREAQLETALGSFHIPLRPICHATEVEFGDQVRDLTRRFFHHLLRYQLFEKAFRLAIDLEDHDLFMDIHYYAKSANETTMANVAREKAREIFNQGSSGNSSQTDSMECSHSSCSSCSGDESSWTESEESKLPPRQPPPLPMTSANVNVPSRTPGEKQKVKFSDTVTHILMPDLPPQLVEECEEYSTVGSVVGIHSESRHHYIVPNPNQELIDSLPLCLGNKDYLKDFATIPQTHSTSNTSTVLEINQDNSEDEDNGNGTIKVVHFGVV